MSGVGLAASTPSPLSRRSGHPRSFDRDPYSLLRIRFFLEPLHPQPVRRVQRWMPSAIDGRYFLVGTDMQSLSRCLTARIGAG